MQTLQERLEEVMREMNWEHADVMRVSGQSSSVVSQWLGKGSKIIKTIGKIEAAQGIERESGYAALWIAKGVGPKKVSDASLALDWRTLAIKIANDWPEGTARDLVKSFCVAVEKEHKRLTAGEKRAIEHTP